METKPAVLIAGATASGKSGYALELAARENGVIVNADAMQVYRDLRILTARPSVADETAAPHRLYGHVPGAVAYSVGQWLRDVEGVLEGVWAEGRLPLIVGGTGLYFKALLEGLSPVPAIPEDVRLRWRLMAETESGAFLRGALADVDPASAARIGATDKQRLVRALEVHEATGRTLTDWQQQPGRSLIPAHAARCVLISRQRETLYSRCDARLDEMIAAGALEEVAALGACGFDMGLPVMRALGVRPLLAHIRGEMQLNAALEAAKMETRRYVKRQITWQRRYMMSWARIDL